MAKKSGHLEPVRSKNKHPDYNVPISQENKKVRHGHTYKII